MLTSIGLKAQGKNIKRAALTEVSCGLIRLPRATELWEA